MAESESSTAAAAASSSQATSSPTSQRSFKWPWESLQLRSDVDELWERVKMQTSQESREFSHEKGVGRLWQVWESCQSGDNKLELRIISNAMSSGGLMGFIFGGIVDSKEIVQDHVRKHNTNIYTGKHQANRQLSDKIYLEFFKRGLKAGLRFALFTGLFVTPITLASTYHDEIRFTDGLMAGALTGAAWKAQLGPRAILTNMILGSLFGVTFAGIMKGAFKIAGTDYRELRIYDMAIIQDEAMKKRQLEETTEFSL